MGHNTTIVFGITVEIFPMMENTFGAKIGNGIYNWNADEKELTRLLSDRLNAIAQRSISKQLKTYKKNLKNISDEHNL